MHRHAHLHVHRYDISLVQTDDDDMEERPGSDLESMKSLRSTICGGQENVDSILEQISQEQEEARAYVVFVCRGKYYGTNERGASQRKRTLQVTHALIY